MPNGHGGYPWMGGPILLLVAFAVVLFLPMRESMHGTQEILALVIAAMFGCRVAYHLHMRSADAYEGAYTNPDLYRSARRKYWVGCVAYSTLCVYLAHLLLEALS